MYNFINVYNIGIYLVNRLLSVDVQASLLAIKIYVHLEQAYHFFIYIYKAHLIAPPAFIMQYFKICIKICDHCHFPGRSPIVTFFIIIAHFQ